MKFFLLIIVLIMLLGCSYSVYMNALPHLRNIQISPFENETSEYTLAQDFQNYLVDKFQSDGRLRISNINPDSYIDGSVLDFKNEVYSYDFAGNIHEYRVSILISIQMTDLRYQQTLYENKSLLVTETYSPTSTNPDVFTTETQAIEKIFEKVFDIVVRNTLEAW